MSSLTRIAASAVAALWLLAACSMPGVAPQAAERYPRLSEAKPTDPRAVPLSTFSIDVDTAAYANVRRHVRDGHLPPPDVPRIEEMINAFDYGYPEPEAERPLSLTTEVAACPWNPANRLVLIGVQGSRLSGQSIPPLNLTFLVDVSGSMRADDKLPLLKDAMALLVERLRRTDTVSIVTYATGTAVVLPPTPGNQRERILDVLDDLSAGGSTNGSGGLELAYATNAEAARERTVNRVLLATDGDFNVGLSSPAALGDFVAQKRESGADITVLGFGTGNLHDANLQALVHRGNGNAHYIDSLDEARRVLSTDAGGTLVTVARDVKIQVEFNPVTVGSYRLLGYETRALADADFDDDRKDAGDLGVGRSVTALYEITPRTDADVAAGSADLAEVRVRYRKPGESRSDLLKRAITDTADEGSVASETLRFAAAVAAFGLVLRDSPFRGTADFELVQDLADEAAGGDDQREAFVELVADAADLAEEEGELRFR